MKDTRQLTQAEIAISYVLRYGVLLCSAVIAIGLLSRLAHVGSLPESSSQIVHTLLQGGTISAGPPPHTITDFLDGIIRYQPDTILALGLVLLISLPILRVAMTVVLFAIELDWAFLGITLVVLTTLLSSIFLGRAL